MSEPVHDQAFTAAAVVHHESVVEAAQAARDGAERNLADLAERHDAERRGAQDALDNTERALSDAQDELASWQQQAQPEQVAATRDAVNAGQVSPGSRRARAGSAEAKG
jgi:Skp family chaperone for outer membrane proteins